MNLRKTPNKETQNVTGSLSSDPDLSQTRMISQVQLHSWGQWGGGLCARTALSSGSSKNHVWRGVRTHCSLPFRGADSPHLLYLPWASIQMCLLLQGLVQASGKKGTRKAQGKWEN